MSDLFLDEIVQPDVPRDHARRSDRRSDRAERDRRRKQRRRKNITALVVVLVVLAGIGFAVWKLGMPLIEDLRGAPAASTDDYPGPGTGEVEVSIPAGATGAAMAQILVDADVVASTGAFTEAFAANPDAPGIQPGTYRLSLQMRAADAVAALINSENRVVTRVTIVEGFTVKQILERLASVTGTPIEELQAVVADPAAIGLPPEAGGNAEGWLFPATYTFEPGQTPAEMLGAMVAQTISVLDERGVPAEARQAVLTKASLVEEESPGGEVSAMIARAIENRLADGMRLEIDAAVAYGAGISGTQITDEVKATDTAYNLYMHAGLPPTPIASPSAASIDAVLAPADGPWLFWVTINHETGETRMAVTYPEHRQNVALLREWEAANGGDD
ncbi:endolytic transglycosylase MltG [Actinotalea fermentans]|uniref:Endolytic murein transglycosylase n=1 Tax=Actinotalea fermentans TaxID=43671 RepID=A0A511YUH4_9CELL|nr:endolytic transglycosylase MltG [Actinotalea fermentans]KGM15442.1 hypothetical protein N867_08390 [Actinotalea fermentans ATCC 43279 = JCM 9966 = DSM 3133]GEN78843.1 hypothetical protein AFE02nite_05770 [Actinotalea fermentans]